MKTAVVAAAAVVVVVVDVAATAENVADVADAVVLVVEVTSTIVDVAAVVVGVAAVVVDLFSLYPCGGDISGRDFQEHSKFVRRQKRSDLIAAKAAALPLPCSSVTTIAILILKSTGEHKKCKKKSG